LILAGVAIRRHFFKLADIEAAIEPIYNNRMFYISRNIETEIFFTHHDMDKAGSDAEVLRRLRDKVEGYCDQEYGCLIQVIVSSETKLLIDRIDIRKEGLYAKVKFTCISFRRTPPSLSQQERDIPDDRVGGIGGLHHGTSWPCPRHDPNHEAGPDLHSLPQA
jgi:hypothetical protein